MFNFKKKSNKKTETEKTKQRCQDWTDIIDIKNNAIHMKHGPRVNLIGIIEVQPVSLALLTSEEKAIKIEQLTSGINSIMFPYQTSVIKKTVDLVNYLQKLIQLSNNTSDPTKRNIILGNMIKNINNIKQIGAMREMKYFIIFSETNVKNENLEKLNIKADQLLNVFNNLSMGPKRLDNMELETTLALYFQNNHSDFYKLDRTDYDNLSYLTI